MFLATLRHPSNSVSQVKIYYAQANYQTPGGAYRFNIANGSEYFGSIGSTTYTIYSQSIQNTFEGRIDIMDFVRSLTAAAFFEPNSYV